MTNVDIALLNSEWVRDHDGEETCPSCVMHRPGSGYEAGIEDHKPGCVHDLALAERGYPTQVERNAARARLKAANEPTLPPPASGAR